MMTITGAVELAAAGISIAIFNQASRITIFPLVSITTSFVAEEDTVSMMNILTNHNDDNTLCDKPESKDDATTILKPNNIVNNVTVLENNNIDASTVAVVELSKNTISNSNNKGKQKKHIASASTALIFGMILGLFQAIFLMFSAKFLLGVMGVKSVSFIC